MSTKSETIAELEGQIIPLKASLEVAQSELQVKEAVIEQLEQAKAALDAELVEVKAALEKLQAAVTDDALVAAREEVCL